MQKLKSRFIAFIKDYSLQFLGLIVLFFIIRVFEYAYVISSSEESFTFHLFMNRSVKYDTLFILVLGAILIIPSLLIALVNALAYKIVIRCFVFLLILIQLTFTQFFLTNNSILTAVLTEFTIEELYKIASHEVSANRLYFWIMNISTLLLTVCLIFTKFNWLKTHTKTYKALPYVTAVLFLIGILSIQSLSKQYQAFLSEYQFLLGNSKPVFFIKSYNRAYENSEITDLTKKLEIVNFQDFYPDREFNSQAFPMVYEAGDENVLGPFFRSDSMKPNIVIIIAESLTGTFSGQTNIIGGSITPFTDSLAEAGLNWTHFLANADRSFGALPNILASLPYGTSERGFMGCNYKSSHGSRYPNQTSILQYLKAEGYQSKYYFGGWKLFDKIAFFMNSNGIDEFTANHNFDSIKYQMKPKHQGERVWGYNDRHLYAQSIDHLLQDKTGKPFISIYQTLTNHSPYNLADAKYYNKAYLNKRLAQSNRKLGNIFIARNTIGSIMAADDDLRYFINEFKKDERFKETIFIIVGDHGVNLKLANHPLESFHVPLIIYSPLIQKPATFAGMSSHIDIAPSLMALLANNFKVPVFNKKHFIGEGLDTSTTFQANRSIPLTINRLEIPSFIVNNILQLGDNFYKLDKNWQTSTASETEAAQAEQWIKTYKIINRIVCDENRIWNITTGTHHNRYD